MTAKAARLISIARIEQRILIIRGQKVMIDSDLAELYGVPTGTLNQAVKRNAERFPPDFMFQLTNSEKGEVITNCDHLTKLKFSPSLPSSPPTIRPSPGSSGAKKNTRENAEPS